MTAWLWIDKIAHRLHVPRRLQAWLCDRADASIGGNPRG